jgi:DNA-binding transcriptional LysR family regulator
VVRLRFGEVALRHRAVREGAGALLLPCFLGDADPALVRLLDSRPELAEDVHLLLHERGRRTRRVRVVADALYRLFRHKADALGGVGQEPRPG